MQAENSSDLPVGPRIKGTVVDLSGQPVAGAVVSAVSASIEETA